MADIYERDFQGLFDDEISDTEPVAVHGAKRRRLNNSITDHDSDNESDYGGESFDSSDTVPNAPSLQEEDEEEEAEKQKPKSKYKIHIPKNSDLPRDAFFTQPPQRSSSPYRIDDFHWKKPRQHSLPPDPKASNHNFAQNSHINLRPAPLGPTDHNAFRNPVAPVSVPTEQPTNDDLDDYDHLYDAMLEDMADDEFADPNINNHSEPILVGSQADIPDQQRHNQRLKAPLTNLKQTTLFGTQAREAPTQTQSNRKHNWPLANREEAPTHHKLETEALETWVYPTNLGTIRDYQYCIVAKGLYHNMLVALPTGLGKTFIAATIMLNWFRWTTNAQIVFVAPTKPLVSQQVKACFEIAGIPYSATSMLTGSTSPGLRAVEWKEKRVFFMTPQTIVNDLKTGICDPKRVVLLVVDEAHRATGGYAYIEVVKFLRRFNTSFRVLALTATPGSSIETVQEVIDGLGISRVEIRTEESLDIRQYVHSRKIETILFDYSEEILMIMDLFSKALQPLVDKLLGMNAYWSRDPMALTPYGCTQSRQRWMSSDAGRNANFAVKGMVNTLFTLLASISHGIELLKFHGIGPFYHKVLAFRNDIHNGEKKGGKYARQINESQPFQTMMSRVQLWINTPDFIGHPKLEYLKTVVMNHFLDAGEGRGASDPSGTRIMVFSHYRDSAEEIARVLKRNDPMVRPHVFVGQANSNGSEGMDQKKQLDIIQKFKSGIYNTLVATSIGEEGLDIGEIDLIVCYDASASPIRMLQRMGRTGRKRAGNIVVTLMKGKEENNFIKAKDNYEKMQSEIASGVRFKFRDDESRRIVPKGNQPVVDKRIIDIPLENTQAELPEPKKRGRTPKRPPKKFHMPDGVRTGFVKASRLDKGEASGGEAFERPRLKRRKPVPTTVHIPSLEDVLLTTDEEKQFGKKYLDIVGEEPQTVEVPRVDAFPTLQRIQRPTKYVAHGELTRRMVDLLTRIHTMTGDPSDHFEKHLLREDREAGDAQAEMRTRFFTNPLQVLALSDYSEAESPILPGNSKVRAKSANARTKQPLSGVIALSSLDDDTTDGVAISSSQSSPQATGTDRAAAVENEFDDDELPDFSTLVNKDAPKGVWGAKAVQRRGKRKVVDDDGDDE